MAQYQMAIIYLPAPANLMMPSKSFVALADKQSALVPRPLVPAGNLPAILRNFQPKKRPAGHLPAKSRKNSRTLQLRIKPIAVLNTLSPKILIGSAHREFARISRNMTERPHRTSSHTCSLGRCAPETVPAGRRYPEAAPSLTAVPMAREPRPASFIPAAFSPPLKPRRKFFTTRLFRPFFAIAWTHYAGKSHRFARTRRLRAWAEHRNLRKALALVHDIWPSSVRPMAGAERKARRADAARKAAVSITICHALRIVEQFEQRYLDFPGLNLTFESSRKASSSIRATIPPRNFLSSPRYLLDLRPPPSKLNSSNWGRRNWPTNTADIDDAPRSPSLLDLAVLRKEVSFF